MNVVVLDMLPLIARLVQKSFLSDSCHHMESSLSEMTKINDKDWLNSGRTSIEALKYIN